MATDASGNEPQASAAIPDDDLQRLFGRNLRTARTEEGLTQADVAKVAGIARCASVSEVENGRGNITFRSMVRLARAVNRQVTVLLAPITKK